MPRYLEFAAKEKRNINWDGIRDVPMPGCMVRDLNVTPIKGIADNSYDGIYSEHFIEHLEKDRGDALLRECFRILKPGGTIRTVWPAMEFVDRLLSSEDMSNHPFVVHYYQRYILQENFARLKPSHYKRKQDACAEGLLYQKGEHKYLWSVIELQSKLRHLGFKKVKEGQYGQSKVPEFNNIETPGIIREMHSGVVEAQKPWA